MEKQHRINMAFTEENYNLIKLVSNATGKSMTEFVNLIIEKYFAEQAELKEQAEKVIEML